MWLVVAFPTAMLAMMMLLALVEDRWLKEQPRRATRPKPVQEPLQAMLVPALPPGRQRTTEVPVT